MTLDTIINPETMFYILVLLVFVGYWLFTFTVVYHLIRFGIGTAPKRLASIYLFGSVAFFCVVFLFFASVNMAALKSNIITLVGSINN